MKKTNKARLRTLSEHIQIEKRKRLTSKPAKTSSVYCPVCSDALQEVKSGQEKILTCNCGYQSLNN